MEDYLGNQYLQMGSKNPSSQQTHQDQPVPIRCNKYSYPILYVGETDPKFYAIRTVYEQWDKTKNDWTYIGFSEKSYWWGTTMSYPC